MNKKILLVLLVCPTLVFAEYSVLIPTTNKIDIKYTGVAQRKSIGTRQDECSYSRTSPASYVSYYQSNGDLFFYKNGVKIISAYASVSDPSDIKHYYQGYYYHPGKLMSGTINYGFYELCKIN